MVKEDEKKESFNALDSARKSQGKEFVEQTSEGLRSPAEKNGEVGQRRQRS